MAASSPPQSSPDQPQITAVVPCFNRPGDLDALLAALTNIDHPIKILIIDNASAPSLESAVAIPESLAVEFLTLKTNGGGSGGFNAGITQALSHEAELVWLLDSDAVPEPDCLDHLLATLESNPDASAVGSALAHPVTGEPYEFGGDIDPRTADLVQHATAAEPEPFRVGYNAACSLLVRSRAVRTAGLLPDLFISGDDAAWCWHLARSFGPVLCAPRSVVKHPHPARMRTTIRFYQARNGVTNAVRFGAPPIARARRVMLELKRAAAQTMLGRDDLASLHLEGVRAAWDSPTGADDRALRFEAYKPISTLDQSLDPISTEHTAPESAMRSLLHWLVARRHETAVVCARAHPSSWVPAHRVISVCDEGAIERRVSRGRTLWALLTLTMRFVVLALRAAFKPPTPPEPARLPARGERALAIVLLTHGARVPTALNTLERLNAPQTASNTEIVLVCNGGADQLPESLKASIPVRVVALETNLGVEAFNHGVNATDADMVLILDDDAWPDDTSLERAVELITRGETDAVAFNRRHPRTREWEWPGEQGPERFDHWPDMGCCNLVRRDAWYDVGGYEAAYFLYRNDTDLALSLVGAGYRVRFERSLFAWHDSPTVGKQSPAWFSLATRNWVWMTRRHARGLDRVTGLLMGWAWAHVRSGARVRCHAATLAGVISGLVRWAPKLRGSSQKTNGRAFASLLAFKSRGRLGRQPEGSPAAARSPVRAD